MSIASTSVGRSNDPTWPPNQTHHIGSPRTHFRNPWPSFKQPTRLELVNARFFRQDRNFVPVPESRDELVQVKKPDWGEGAGGKLKATWIGHASWLVELPAGRASDDSRRRGARVLLDPVFADRTSPVTFFGPKRYTPLPCTLAELPEVDVVCISHNHYDHLDIDSIQTLHKKNDLTVFLVPLGNKSWFEAQGVKSERVVELDWWQGVDATVHVNDGKAGETARIVCTPAQHLSQRSAWDAAKTLWCSWALGTVPGPQPAAANDGVPAGPGVEISHIVFPDSIPAEDHSILGRPSLYFAGDTGYRSVASPTPSPDEVAAAPHCPAFESIGKVLGPFDLALLPVGLYSPRDLLSSVHCCPEDAVDIAKDVRAVKSIGMHYGTFRGGISNQYEDVTEPPRRWKEACESGGLAWGEQAGLCSIGETVIVE